MRELRDLNVLINQAKQHNSDALTKIYDEFLPQVFRYVFYQVNNRTVAEDITSETFLKMLTAIRNFREDGRSFYPWLLKIARNTTLDYLRVKSRQAHISLEDELEELIFIDRNAPDLEQIVLSNIDAEEIRLAMRKLTDEQQQVLLLKFTMGLSNAETGKVMDKNEGSIKSLQVRALGALRKHLNRDGRYEEKIEPSISTGKVELYKNA
jgi:RNA polymerase sigma-70 factor (ECF subfamily)